jgi:undecaprenyl-diphosphatase
MKYRYILLVYLAASILFWLLLEPILANQALRLDTAIVSFAEMISNPFIIKLFRFVTELGSKWGIGVLLLFSLFWLWYKYRDLAGMVFLAIAVIGGNELNRWCKELVRRERPLIDPTVDGVGYSFPSGHAMAGFIFFGFIAYLLNKHIKSKTIRISISLLTIVFIFLIGFSRIILNVHYPSDVIGGYLLGGLFGGIWLFFYEFFNPIINRKIEEQRGASM